MRVLFFIESLRSGGKERRLVELIKNLSGVSDLEMELVLMREEIHYKDIRDINIKVHIIERSIVKKDPRLFFSFYKIANKFKPDVIHAWGNMSVMYSVPSKVLLKIPLINSQISDIRESKKNTLINRINFLFSNKIIANSEAGLKSYNIAKDKGLVIHNGFDITRLKNLEKKSKIFSKFRIESEFVIGMVASFSRRKDYKTYITAALDVVSKKEDVTFLCIGDGDDSVYKKMVPDKFKDRVLFLGKQSNVESIMNICKIGVLATYTEGIPNSIMEFMALGKPVIATDGGGTSELIVQGESGYLIPQKNSKELSGRIIDCIENYSRCSRTGENAIKRIRDSFSIEKMIDSYYKVYSELVY